MVTVDQKQVSINIKEIYNRFKLLDNQDSINDSFLTINEESKSYPRRGSVSKTLDVLSKKHNTKIPQN